MEMEYNMGRIKDIVNAFNLIQQKQDIINHNLKGMSTTLSAINEKATSRLEVLKTQVYVYSGSLGWLGIWDSNTKNYTGFVNTGTSVTGKMTVAAVTGDVFLLGDNENRVYVIDPYLPGIKGTLLLNAVASYAVSTTGKRIFISQHNSSILLEIDVTSGNIMRKFILPGTGQHLVFYPEAYLVYFSVAGTKAVYSVQHLSGEVVKVFDLPDDAVKIAHYMFGNQFGLLVLSGSGNEATITRWDKATNTTVTVQVADASELVVNPYTGQNYVISLENLLFRTLDGTLVRTVDLGDTASQLTLTADGNHLIAAVSAGNDALVIDTISGVFTTGPRAIYPPTQQPADILLVQAQFGFTSN